MKKKLTFLMLLLAFVALALVSCQGGTGSRPTTPTTSTPVFEVVFVAGDGEILKTESVELGQGATAPEVPNRTGYVFVGWDTDFSYVDCSITVTAVYARVWTVQFVDAQGNEVRTFSVVDGEASPAPNVNPYLEGHTFIGWDQDYSSVKSDMIIRPLYQAEGKFTVTFLGKDGEVLKTQSVFAGGNAMAPAAPSIPHFTFKGWDKEYTNVTEDITVNAIYEEDPKFTVSFYDHNGNLIGQDSVYAGASATAPSLTLAPHFTFKNWDKPFSYVQEDMSVYAVVEEDAKFTVEFVDFDSSVLSSQTVYIGEDAIAPADPIREGFTFIGWDKGFSRVQNNMTVNALYRDNNKFSVVFKDRDGNILKAEDVTLGESATAPMAPAIDNYTFAGWDKDFSNVTEDLVVVATYTENAKYTVSFVDYNGNVLHSEVVYAGKAATAPANPSRENYSFVGWDKTYTNVQADLTVNAVYRENTKFTVTFVDYDGTVLKTETVYQGKAATAPGTPAHSGLEFTGWDKGFSNVQSNLTVTATYERYYTVKFVDENDNVLKTQNVKEGASAAAPAAPVKDGYVFAGWDKAFDKVTADLVVVARYEIVKHNVIFSVVGGESPATQVVEHGNKASQPADPVREGFAFVEWHLGGVKYDFASPVVGDITLVAYFKSNGQMPAITNDTLKIDPAELELWVGVTLQLNIMPNGETVNFMANSSATFDFISTDPAVVSIEDDGTFTAHALGTAKIYAVVTKGGSYVGSKATYTANVGDVIGLCYMTVVETDEYYQNFLDDPENQKITLGSTSTARIDKNEFLSFPSGEYGSANIALWYNGTEAVFTATVDDNSNVMADWAKWAVFADDFGIPTTFITPSMSGYANEGTLWQVIGSSEYAMVQSHGATHLAINQHHSSARIWHEFYYGRKQIDLVSGHDALIIGYANGTNYAPISSLFFIGGRGVAGHLNGVEKIDYNCLNSFSGFPSDIPGKMNTLLGDNASNGWMSVHYHQMGNSADTIRDVYEQMYPYIESGRLWAALFADASQYGQERDTATLTMLQTGGDLIRFTLTDQMNDILFYHPLSVRIKVDSSWTGARAYQNGEEVKVQIINRDGETYLMVDAIPDKGEVSVVRTALNIAEQSDSMILLNPTDNLNRVEQMTLSFPVSYHYAYATQNGVQVPAYVKNGLVYVTVDVNGGEVKIIPLTSQYDSMSSYTMTMIYNGYATPDAAKSITIASAEEMVMFSKYVNAGNTLAGITVELIADIDMTSVDYQGAGFNFTYKGSSGSYMVRPFSGVFEGNKHKIYNLNLSQLTIDAGIFGYIKDAIVRNLNVEGTVSGGERVGGIASYADNSIISQCSFTGNVIASVIHKNQATGRSVGGIVGTVRNGSLIEHCNFSGNVMSIPCESYDIEVYNIGGIVGGLGAGTVNNCSMNGSVTAGDNSKNLGGIIGTIEASGEGGLRIVSNCFANVNIKGGEQIGGLIGYLSCNSSSRSSNVYNCSVIGSVTGNNYVGGLLGFGGGLSAYMVNCFSGVTVNAPEAADYVGTVCGGYQADSYGLRINDNFYVGSLNPGMPVSVKISGSGSFSCVDVADGAAALDGLNTKANATANYNAWRLVDGIPSACYEEICTVTFVDKNGDVISFVSLPKGFAATAPSAPLFEGFEFTGWDKAYDNVTSDMTVTALYKEVSIFNVTFVGKDGVVLKTEKVNEGLSATAPSIPTIEGWRFDGWDKTFDTVNSHLTVTAKYVKTWNLTYLNQAGEVWKVEVYDEGAVPTLAIAPAVKGATFITWDPATVGLVTEDVVLTPVYQTRPATSAADYTVMHWTLGGNTVYTGNYQKNIQNAVAAADPDIVIITGMDSQTLKNPKTVFSFSEGYSCWAYGAGSSNSPAAATEAVHRYVGSGVAVYYKTDLFSPAGEVGHGFPGGDRVSQFTIFPLANNEGVIIPVVVSYMVGSATEAQRAKWVTELKEALGNGFDAAIIRLYVEGSNAPDASWSASFNQAADENGYSLVCDSGTNVKKTQGQHNSTSQHYVYMMTYSNNQPTASLSQHTSVQITEDSTVYPNNHATNTAFYDVAYTAKFSIGAISIVGN